MKKDLNNIPDIKHIGVPNICFSLTDSADDREEVFIKQRKIRGFDDSECWSLDSTIVSFILPRLKVFRIKTKGFPYSIETMEQWHEILDEMIKSFDIMSKEVAPYDNNNAVEKGLNLFRKYFHYLWW